MNILFVSPEIFPYSKTGGLADVAGSLPIALSKLDCNLMVVAPYYKTTRKKWPSIVETGKRVAVSIDKFRVQGTLLKNPDSPFPMYFINQPAYFNREFLYGDAEGDYSDNAERFIFFSKAVMEACAVLGFYPDIIHCHDWQTGLIPVYLKTLYRDRTVYKNTAVVFTVHNLAYQGNFGFHHYAMTGLSEDLYNPEALEFYGYFSFLKAGLIYSDVITTVSGTYRDEILKKENGCGMEGVLKNRIKDLEGIENGIDSEKWNPARDASIAARFSPKDRGGKQGCRLDLLKHFKIKVSPKNPIVVLITRLIDQKGVDLVIRAMDSIMERNVSFVLLGSGDPEYEEFFKNFSIKYPGKVGVHIGFSEDLARKIYAGADLFLMPSKFEPCGLTQLIAMRYGAVPVVRAVGGLIDTVHPFDSGKDTGNGFCFKGFSPEDLLNTLDRAITEFHRKKSWGKLVKRVMEENHSWESPAKRYIQLYKKAIHKRI